MKLTTITATLFALAITTISAQNVTDAGVAVNTPARGDVWNAGTAQTIKFTMTDPSITSIEGIVLMGGDQGNLQTYLLVDSNVPVNGGQYSWNIPKNIQTMPSYALVFKTNKGKSYSPYFTIVGMAAGQQGGLGPTSINLDHLPSKTGSSASSTNGGSSSSGSNAKPSNDGDSLKVGALGILGSTAAALFVLSL
ncbi:hypothetical protein BC941DRAFT_437550 [Chlamydoabsidia padenii]|nr:hypothetical protein BC941DRAFT_437550 [Chlamydoabsidia padenii]